METFQCAVLYQPETAELAFLPEGPYPCPDHRLSWVAIQHGADAGNGSLNLLDLATGSNTTYPLDGRPGFAFAASRPDQFLVGLERQLVLLDLAKDDVTTLTAEVDADVEGTIINDGVLFEGGVVFGTKDLNFREPKASLYLWRRSDQELIRLRDDQVCSNGKAIIGQGPQVTLIDIDSPTRTVVRYTLDVAAGTLSEPDVVVDLRDEPGFPDGMVLSPDGNSAIVAIYDPSDVTDGEARMYDLATGRLQAVWHVPGSPQVTCPQLVRHEGEVKLVLTTAVEHMSPERQQRCPNAGSLMIGPTPFDQLPPQPVFDV